MPGADATYALAVRSPGCTSGASSERRTRTNQTAIRIGWQFEKARIESTNAAACSSKPWKLLLVRCVDSLRGNGVN
jgi:hypothetical protein